MADEDEAAAEIRQHRAADLTGEGALGMLRHILGTPGHATAVQLGPGLRQIRIGHADGDLGLARGAIANGLQQSRVGGKAAMHFPVSGNELGAHLGKATV